MSSKPKLVAAVIGAGTMGHGIAQVLGLAGHQVRLQDPRAEALASAEASVASSLELFMEQGLVSAGQSRACLERITYLQELAPACADADLVLEAIPEDIEQKRRLYRSVEDLVSSRAIVGSNTSALSISSLAEGLRHPRRFLGIHFWNPAQVMPCVEVIRGRQTADEVFERTVSLLAEAGKEPVRVNKDVPGFLGNRLQHALQREALYLVEAGIAEPEDVDRVVKHGFGLRYAFMGPLERADLGGLDVTLAVQRYLLKDLDGRTEASPLLEERVARGDLGLKSGRGFYQWSRQRAAAAAKQRDSVLLGIIKLLRASRERTQRPA